MDVDRRSLLSLGLLALVVLAGCQSAIDPTGHGDQSTNATTTDTAPVNPWNAESLTVAVTTDLEDRNYSALAEPAIAFWNENRATAGNASYGTLPRLELTTDTGSADVLLHYTPTVARCGGETAGREAGFYHCAPVIDQNASVDGQLEYRVTSRFTNDTTTDLTVNALGGLYGVTAPDEPRAIRSPQLLDPFPRTDTVTVGISYVAQDRNITPLVQAAVDYWMAVDDEHGDYQTEWVVDPDAERPDVVVQYVDTIVQCGFGPNHEYYIGCTELLSTERSANTPVHVEIASGYTDESTTTTIKHEFGHLYGREHGQSPMPLMSATGDAVPMNESNATA